MYLGHNNLTIIIAIKIPNNMPLLEEKREKGRKYKKIKKKARKT